jgi:hypothetical protein
VKSLAKIASLEAYCRAINNAGVAIQKMLVKFKRMVVAGAVLAALAVPASAAFAAGGQCQYGQKADGSC